MYGLPRQVILGEEQVYCTREKVVLRSPRIDRHVMLQTIDMILGNKEAPWEDAATSRALLKPLGIFKSGVMGLVARDPEQRSSIFQFQQSCRRSLSNTHLTAT